MTLLSIEHIVGCEGYYIDDDTLQIWSFKNNNNGKLMKGSYDKNGYLRYHFYVNGKYKKIFYQALKTAKPIYYQDLAAVFCIGSMLMLIKNQWELKFIYLIN